MKGINSLKTIESIKIGSAVVLIGVGAGVFSYIFHFLVHTISHLSRTNEKFDLSSLTYSIGFVTVSYFLTKKVFKDTSGSGIPQVKLALAAYKGKMPKRMPFGKLITSFFTLCSGLSFGKEGPMVTIAAAWGHLVSHFFSLNRQLTKVLVASGAAAGLAAAFNTPIAAVIFTVEEILGELKTKYLGPIIVTSVIASVTSFKLLGGHATFIPVHYKFHVEWHLVFYLLLGLFMSLVGLIFTKSILMCKEIKRKYFTEKEYIFLLLVVGLVGISSQYSSDLLGDGVSLINRLLDASITFPLLSLFILFSIKNILAATSYSTGLSGGLFMPVLLLGALGGHGIGSALDLLGVEGIEVGAFTLLGMTSLLVGVIRTPFTAFVLLFEMTHDYELILPLMVSSIAAYWLSDIINPNSVYEDVAEYEGVHLPTQKDNECLHEMSIEECMVKDVMTLDAELTVSEAQEKIKDQVYSGYPIMKDNRLYGILNICEISEQFEKDPAIKLKDITKYNVIYVYPDQSLLIALDKMKRFNLGRLPVVTRFNHKVLLGLITPHDIVNFLGLSKSELE